MSDNHDLLNDNNMCSFEEHEAENVCSNKDAVACGDYNRATSYRFVKILEFTHFCSFFNFGRTDVKRNKKQIVDRIHVVVGYRVDTRDTIFFDE